MKFIVVAAIAALSFAPVKSQASAVLINSTCELGNCANPTSLTMGNSTSDPFDFTYTLANSDTYHLAGNVSAVFNTNFGFALSVSDFVATYEGNSMGTASGNDVLASQYLVNLVYPTSGSGTGTGGFESVDGVFGPGLGDASSATAQFSIGSSSLPVMGPFTPPPADFADSVSNQPFSFTKGVPNLLDYRYTLTFGEGSTVGSSIGINPTSPPPTSPVPEPSSLLLLGTGIVGALGAFRMRLKPGRQPRMS